jgi:hypothetical protein
VPLLLRGLDLEDYTIRANVIDTFLAVSEGGLPEKSVISEHAPSLIATMVKNSTRQEKNSMVRGTSNSECKVQGLPISTSESVSPLCVIWLFCQALYDMTSYIPINQWSSVNWGRSLTTLKGRSGRKLSMQGQYLLLPCVIY